MLNPTSIMTEALCADLRSRYERLFGDRQRDFAVLLDTAAQAALGHIANSDAAYHDVQHTLLVTSAGQEILRGRFLVEEVTPEDWLHFTLATICHDVGYVRGVCQGDTENAFVMGESGETVTPPRGASDAFLTPYHVDRGKIFARETFGPLRFVDEERIARAIEMTRFPIPEDEEHANTESEEGLVRASDLIGQLGDPNYLRKQTNLFHEFLETGAAELLGYEDAADLADSYPAFYWSCARPYLDEALRLLRYTPEGKQWIANLQSSVFELEHRQKTCGPFRTAPEPVRTPANESSRDRQQGV